MIWFFRVKYGEPFPDISRTENPVTDQKKSSFYDEVKICQETLIKLGT